MNKIFVTLIVFLFFVLILFLNLNNREARNDSSGKLNIVVSNYALESMTEDIVGNKAKVIPAYDFSTEIHEKSSLTAKEMEDILQSDIFICISSKYESFVKGVESSVKNGETATKLVEIGDDYKDLPDEHIFVSPRQAKEINKVIYDTVAEYDEDNKDFYKSNYDSAIAKLDEIDKDYAEFAKTNDKTIYVEHDAYYFLREDYGLDIKGVHGKSHESEVTTKAIEDITKDIQKQDIKAVYAESKTSNDPVLETLHEETGARVDYLNNLEIDTGIDYLAAYKNNLETLKRG